MPSFPPIRICHTLHEALFKKEPAFFNERQNHQIYIKLLFTLAGKNGNIPCGIAAGSAGHFLLCV